MLAQGETSSLDQAHAFPRGPFAARAPWRRIAMFNRRSLWMLLLLGLTLSAAHVGAAPAPLVVYTYSSFGQELVDLMQKDFAKRVGMPVEVRTFPDAGPLFNQLVQERNAPKADVVIGLDSFDLPKALKYDLFTPFKAKNLTGVDRRFVFDRQ